MNIDRRQFLESTSKVALFAGSASIISLAPVVGLTAANAQQVSGLYDDLPLPDKVLGKEDAPVTIVEYASMTCPHCKNFHENALKEIKANYIETGKVKLIFREFPLDNRAVAAAMLARCAPADKYFPMLDILFAQQGSWSTSKDPRTELFNISKMAGFSKESFEACISNAEIFKGVKAIRARGGDKFDVNSTPTLFIGGVKFSGELSYKGVSAAIDALL
jgi:protein-disulfide isomerase